MAVKKSGNSEVVAVKHFLQIADYVFLSVLDHANYAITNRNKPIIMLLMLIEHKRTILRDFRAEDVYMVKKKLVGVLTTDIV